MTAKTRAGLCYSRLRAEILAGRLMPGVALSPAEISVRSGVSVTVVREAIARLAAEGLVTARPQIGFTVKALTESELNDLLQTLCEVESLVLRNAIQHGGLAWEAGIIAAHHMLAGTPVHESADPHATTDDHAAAHSAFHNALVAACDSQRLLSIWCSLIDALEPYRRLSYALDPNQAERGNAEHAVLMNAALARDAEQAVKCVRLHYVDGEPSPAAMASRLVQMNQAADLKTPSKGARSARGFADPMHRKPSKSAEVKASTE